MAEMATEIGHHDSGIHARVHPLVHLVHDEGMAKTLNCRSFVYRSSKRRLVPEFAKLLVYGSQYRPLSQTGSTIHNTTTNPKTSKCQTDKIRAFLRYMILTENCWILRLAVDDSLEAAL